MIMIVGAGGLALLFFFVIMPILRGPGPAKEAPVSTGPVAEVDPLIVRFIDDVKNSGQRPPRIVEPRAASVFKLATDRARLTEISNPVRLRSACMNAEALLALYRKGRNPTDKTNPSVLGPNGAFASFDPYYLDEIGTLAGYVVRCLGAQIAAMERAIDVAGLNALDIGQRNTVRDLKLAATIGLENLFASAIPEGNSPEYRAYSLYADAVLEYSIVYTRALAPAEREKLLDKATKYVERVPPFQRDNALRITRTLNSSECIRMCKMPAAR